MRLFISYSNADRELAGNIKTHLQQEYGFNVFLAHDDIQPTREWEEEILSSLSSCDVFIPIITEHFYDSEWTDQETGFALGRDILIISIKFGKNPRGFLKKYQAYNHRNVESTYKKILKIIVENADLSEAALDSLLRKFGESNSYDSAGNRIYLLLEFESKLSTSQKNEILNLAASNRQIRESNRAKSRLRRFIAENEGELEDEIVTRYRESI